MRRPPLAPSPLAFALLAALTSSALVAPIARPAPPERGAEVGRGVRSVFFVAKSENRNEVHYGVALDSACVPAGSSPVFAYWRMRERSPLATEPLLAREVSAYGIAEPQRVERGELEWPWRGGLEVSWERRRRRMCQTAAGHVERRRGGARSHRAGQTLARCEAIKAKCPGARARQGRAARQARPGQ